MKQSASPLRQRPRQKRHKRKLELQLNMVAKLWDLSLIHKSNTWPRKRQGSTVLSDMLPLPPPPFLAIQQPCQTTFHCSTLAYFAYFRLPFFGCDIVTNFYATQFLWQTFPIFICIPCKQHGVCLSYKLAFFLVCICICISLGICKSCMLSRALILFAFLYFVFYYFFFSVKTCLQAQNYCDRR